MPVFDDLCRVFRRTEAHSPPFPGAFVPEHDPEPDMPGRATWEEGLAPAGEDLAGIIAVLDYKDSAGRLSRRRITLHKIEANDAGQIYLRAFCHERQAPRSFRFDRVRSVIDLDGVFHEPDRFFADVLQVDVAALGSVWAGVAARRAAEAVHRADPMAAPPPGEKPGMAQRRAARDGARVLAALARADGYLHAEEIEVILDYIAERADTDGIATSEADRAALVPYVRRLFPTVDVLDRCLEGLERERRSDQRLLMRFAIQLMDADGVQDPAEFELMLRIQEHLAG